MGEESVESTADVVQVLFWILGDRDSIKVVRVHDSGGVVEVVNHVVYGTAVRGTFVSGAYEDVFLVSRHFWTCLGGTCSKKLNNKEI